MCQYINFYSNKTKALSTVKCWEIWYKDCFLIKNDFFIKYIFFLSHSIVSLCSSSTKLLFCILLKNSGKYNEEQLSRLLVSFKYYLHWELKLLLVPIYLHLQKLSGRYQIRTSYLPSKNTINMLLEKRHVKNTLSHYLSLENMIFK